MIGTIFKWAISVLTGGSLEKILDVIDRKMDNDVKKEELQVEVTKTWINAQANLLVGRTWWFQLFFVIPLGFHWACLMWVSAVPALGWTVLALPAPFDSWAGSIVAALFIVDGTKSVIGRFVGNK